LDGFVTGVPGASDDPNPDVQLAVSDKVTAIPAGIKEFDAAGAKAWRSNIYALQKVVGTIKFGFEQLVVATESCKSIPCVPVPLAGCTDFPKAVCNAVGTGLKVVFPILIYAAELSFDISQKIYSEVVDEGDADYESERQTAIYENSILNARNIITTFHATQQLKVMLGDISEGIEGIQEDVNNRRLSSCVYTEGSELTGCTCVSTNDGFQLGCSITSCEDPTRICDGSYNYQYISTLLTGECLILSWIIVS
jgi:hypothetical protein